MSTTIRSLDYIITAKHYGGSGRGYIVKQQHEIHRQRGIAVTIKDLDKEPTGAPVYAWIWNGQWVAECECKGMSFVDPDEPVFFCFSCGNRAHGQKPRPVVFPPADERKEIERLLLLRPVDDTAGLTDNERAGLARALIYVDIEEDVNEPLSLAFMMDAAKNGKLPPRPKAVRTKALTRSWRPGETIDDLHQQQDKAIALWKAKSRETV